MATVKSQKRVGLTCKCGASYILNTIHDLPSRCTNGRCCATLDTGAESLWKYHESIITLMRTLGLGRDYWNELDFAKRMSRKVASPYTIEIVEVDSQ